MLYEKILDAPRQEFSIPPPPKSNKDSDMDDGVIGMTSTKSTKATSKKSRKISYQNGNEEILASKVNVVPTDKGKEPKQPRGMKKGKSRRRNIMIRLLKNLLQTLLGKRNLLSHASYVIRIIGQEIVHIKLKLRNSLRIQEPQQY